MDDDIDECIQTLTEFNDRSIHLLDPQLNECMDKIMEYRSQNPSLYSHKIKQYHRPVDIKPGTVGVSLFGCEQHFYGNVDDRCTCLCLQETCKKQVWIVTKKRLHKLNDSNDKYAYLYVPENFKLTKNHERILRKSGITEICLLDTTYSRHSVIKTINLPDVEEVDQSKLMDQFNNKESTIKDSNNLWLWIAGFVILIFIAVVWHLINFNKQKKITLEEPNIFLGGLNMTSRSR